MTKALSLPQPLPECVLRHDLRCLRLSAPPGHGHYSTATHVGARIALYASGEVLPYRAPDHRDPSPVLSELDIPIGLPREAVVATATIAGYFTAEAERRGGVWERLVQGPGGHAFVGTTTSGVVIGAHCEHVQSTKNWLDVCDAALASPWWSVFGADVSVEELERRAVPGSRVRYVPGRVRAYGWILEDVVELDPPVGATRPKRNAISDAGVWELGRVAAAEVALREEYAREVAHAG